MKGRKFLLLALLAFLMTAGMLFAQSSANYNTQRFTAIGGGAADSANYSVVSVFGQQATGYSNSSNYKASSGFLFPIYRLFPAHKIWLPALYKP